MAIKFYRVEEENIDKVPEKVKEVRVFIGEDPNNLYFVVDKNSQFDFLNNLYYNNNRIKENFLEEVEVSNFHFKI